MANVDRPSGFKPVGNLSSSSFNAGVRAYSVASGYASNIFVGDAVKSGGSADAEGVASCELAAAGDTKIGVVVGVVIDARGTKQEYPGYHPASTAGTVLVNINPDQVYEVQEDAAGGALALASVGLTADHVATAGNTTTGNSNMELDSSDAGTGAGWKIIGFSQRVDNEPGVANAKVLVKMNEHEWGGAGSGV